MKNTRALTVSESGQRLGFSHPTTRKYLKMGLIPGAKIGSNWRVDPEALEQLLRGDGGNGGTKQSEPDLPEAA